MTTTTATPIRLDLLIRTSKRKAEAKSPAQQRQLAENVCKIHGYEIAMVHDSGADESGKTMARPSIEAIRERIRTRQTDGMIVGLLDRVGRAPIEEAMTVLREMGGDGGLFVPADQGGAPIDLSDPQAETNLVIQLQIARQFWLTSRKRFRLSQSNAINRGVATYPKVPLGYVRVESGENRGCLALDPATAAIVGECFARRRDGALISDVRTYLADHGITRSYAGVRDMFKSRVYLGELIFGDVTKTGLANRRAHEPIVDVATFDAIQRLVVVRGRRAPSERLLARLRVLRCGTCGRWMSSSTQTGRQGAKTGQYVCAGTHGACPQRAYVSAALVEGEVVAEVQRLIAHKRGHASVAVDARAAREAADVADLAVGRAMRLAAKFPDEAEGDRLVDEASAERDQLRDVAVELERQQAALDEIDPTVDWDEMTLVGRRALIAAVIDRVVVMPGRSADRVSIVARS